VAAFERRFSADVLLPGSRLCRRGRPDTAGRGRQRRTTDRRGGNQSPFRRRLVPCLGRWRTPAAC
jgi:hypothetical protein